MTTINDLINRSVKVTGIEVTSAVLQQAASEIAADKAKKVVSSVKGLLETFTENLTANVATLKRMREQEKVQKKTVDTLDRAVRYFAATGNPLPVFAAQGGVTRFNRSAQDWCRNVGIEMPEAEDQAWKVPAEWVVPTGSEQAE